MILEKHSEFEVIERCSRLDLVVPFTTPALTRAAMHAANRMGSGLSASIRLVKVQVVPFPMDINQPPVALEFVRAQLEHFESELPAEPEIRLARDFEPGLVSALKEDSVVVIARRRRRWRTREERLAASLWRRGYRAVLVGEKDA